MGVNEIAILLYASFQSDPPTLIAAIAKEVTSVQVFDWDIAERAVELSCKVKTLHLDMESICFKS